eukprot:TRINITY_DN5848_c0_g1_i1.p1 TRINITY_DN5848_c0_g1~~TRINITY_DN5848_c0_g1_i1.p1  ORF type:complete len:129 (-),score=29.24 TRINITY_DN5848_c0_g1_i1:259-645(-)
MEFFAFVLSALFQLLSLVLTVLYPAAATFEALETPGEGDDQQWLTFWVINAALQLLELFAGSVLKLIPFYYTLKLAFVGWLVIPQTRGAHFLYLAHIRPRGLVVRGKLHEQFGDLSHVFKPPVVVKEE